MTYPGLSIPTREGVPRHPWCTSDRVELRCALSPRFLSRGVKKNFEKTNPDGINNPTSSSKFRVPNCDKFIMITLWWH